MKNRNLGYLTAFLPLIGYIFGLGLAKFFKLVHDWIYQ